MSPLVAAGLGTLGFILLWVGISLPRGGRSAVDERLARLTARTRNLEQLEIETPFADRILRPFIRKLADALGRFQQSRARASAPAREAGLDSVRRKLALAGHPYGWAPADYLGVKAFGALVMGGVLFFLLTISGYWGHAIGFGLFGLTFGWFTPDLLLRSKIRARQKQIRTALPDALDLLVISVEAGLGFDAAIHRLVQKKSDALATEFARVLAEMRVGRSRRDALKDLVLRTQVPDLNAFVGAILQAEQLGVSVTRVLSVQADQMRVLRRQRAEEKAAQLQLKLIFPLAIFIFPALCIVIMGPIWPTLAGTSAPGI